MNLDQELRAALQRKDPPAGFEQRTLTRIARGETRPAPAASWRRILLPLAASIILLLAGTYVIRVSDGQRARDQQLAVEQASGDVALALRIASEKVAAVQAKFQETTHDQSNRP